MANPAILAGLLAGYTVGAVVTALLAAKELSPTDPSMVRSRLDLQRASAVVCNPGRRARRTPMCLRTDRQLTSPRR